MDFPRLVYRSPTSFALVLDQDKYDELLKNGWFATVPEAVANSTAAPVADKAPSVGTKAKGGNWGSTAAPVAK